MATFTNSQGQEPSPPADPSFGVPSAADLAADQARRNLGQSVPKRMPAVVARFGREAVDLKQCQAPCKPVGPFGGRARCDRPATCVAVENKPRFDGAIAAMGLCDICRDTILSTQGSGYAKLTAIDPKDAPGLAHLVALARK